METPKNSSQRVSISDNPLSDGLWGNVPMDTSQYTFKATNYGWIPKKVQ